jgi:DNA-binding transcriptional MocR family regulator
VRKSKDTAGDGEHVREEPHQGRIHGSIARTLGVAIVSGQYAPGDVLNNEIDSSEQLQVSRSAYREAIRILAAKGLVESPSQDRHPRQPPRPMEPAGSRGAGLVLSNPSPATTSSRVCTSCG